MTKTHRYLYCWINLGILNISILHICRFMSGVDFTDAISSFNIQCVVWRCNFCQAVFSNRYSFPLIFDRWKYFSAWVLKTSSFTVLICCILSWCLATVLCWEYLLALFKAFHSYFALMQILQNILMSSGSVTFLITNQQYNFIKLLVI